MSLSTVHTDSAPKAIGPYSQATVVDIGHGKSFVFTAGQIGLDPATMELVEGGIEEQARQVIRNLSAVLDAAGARWDQVVKTVIYLAEIDDFAVVNRIYGEALSDPPPARSTVGVDRLPKGALVEMDLVALIS